MSDGIFTKQYLQEGKLLNHFELSNAETVCWESPSNIALIKYWGKFGDQLPLNPSISFTLKNSKTVTKITYQKAKNAKPNIEYFFENKKNLAFEEKVKGYFEKISVYLPFIAKLNFKIYSHNTFPHSAGVASSASSFSALALCLCNIENNLFKTLTNNDDLYQKASFLARLGSGSACRSIYGKTVLWGKTNLVNGSTNELALPIDSQVHNVFKTYGNAILIIDSGKKTFSSTEGHRLMQNHPFANARHSQALDNTDRLITALNNGDEQNFAQIVENEALTLHALMLSSNPSICLMKPNTLAVITKLREFRDERNLNFAFTLDAGPNIHILYPQTARNLVFGYINSELKAYCENEAWIDDELSEGPKPINIVTSV